MPRRHRGSFDFDGWPEPTEDRRAHRSGLPVARQGNQREYSRSAQQPAPVPPDFQYGAPLAGNAAILPDR